MQTVRNKWIIGCLILIGLTLRANDVLAIYSPRLSQQAALIRQHIQGSQAQNGTQSIMEEIEQIKAYDKAKREAFLETGISGNVRVAQDLIFNTTLDFLIQNPFDSLFMIFNFNAVNGEWISQCLRDDIWSLELLRDKVGAEMIKAYMLRDTFHGALLMEDYGYLTRNLDLLRKFGSDPSAEIDALDASQNPIKITSTKYFFGNNGTDPNYYKDIPAWTSNETGCPETEFQEAFREVVNASQTFATLSSGGGSEWGNIWEIAKANARIRAKQWIRANQISLTVGGESGGRVESLVKGGGVDKFVGYWKAQWKIMENMVGPVTPFIDAITNYQPPAGTETPGTNCRFYRQTTGYFAVCNTEQIAQYDQCKEDKDAAEAEGIRCDRFRNAEESITMFGKLNDQARLEQERADMLEDVQNAFVYSITLDSVAEQNLLEVDQIMWDLNQNIKRGYEGVSKEAGDSIPSLTRMVSRIADIQCANKPR